MKVYLGDGVYAERDKFEDIWLTTEDGISVTNKICLEPSVYANLREFAEPKEEEKE